MVVEEVTLPAVRVGGEGEVEGGHALALGDGLHELVLGHRSEGVVGGALLTDGGGRRGGQVLPAGGAGAVGGVDQRLVGQGHQLLVERAVEVAGQARRRVPADRGEQVGPADVTDEERVAGEHRPRLGIRVLADDDRDRLRRVAGGVTDLEVTSPRESRWPWASGSIGKSGGHRRRRRWQRRWPRPARGGRTGSRRGSGSRAPARCAGRGRSASARYSLMSRWGSTTTARPVVVVADQVAVQREAGEVVLAEEHGEARLGQWEKDDVGQAAVEPGRQLPGPLSEQAEQRRDSIIRITVASSRTASARVTPSSVGGSGR